MEVNVAVMLMLLVNTDLCELQSEYQCTREIFKFLPYLASLQCHA